MGGRTVGFSVSLVYCLALGILLLLENWALMVPGASFMARELSRHKGSVIMESNLTKLDTFSLAWLLCVTTRCAKLNLARHFPIKVFISF